MAAILGGAHRVILAPRNQGTDVELVINLVVQRARKAAGDNLFTKHHTRQQTVVILGFAAGHHVKEDSCDTQQTFLASQRMT